MEGEEQTQEHEEVAPELPQSASDADEHTAGPRPCSYVKSNGIYRGRKCLKNAYHMYGGRDYCMHHCRMMRQMEAEPRRRRVRQKKEEYFGEMEEKKSPPVAYQPPPPQQKPPPESDESEYEEEMQPIQLQSTQTEEPPPKKGKEELLGKLLKLEKKYKRVKKRTKAKNAAPANANPVSFLDFGSRMGMPS